MSNLAFDTHKFVKDLTKANMPEDQAVALAQHYANLLDDRLATKDDLKLLKGDLKLLKGDLKLLKSDLEKVESELKAEISGLRKDMVYLEERLNARIVNVALKTQLAGVVIICTVLGVLYKFF